MKLKYKGLHGINRNHHTNMHIFNKIVKEKKSFLSIKFMFGIKVKMLINLGLNGMNKYY